MSATIVSQAVANITYLGGTQFFWLIMFATLMYLIYKTHVRPLGFAFVAFALMVAVAPSMFPWSVALTLEIILGAVVALFVLTIIAVW